MDDLKALATFDDMIRVSVAEQVRNTVRSEPKALAQPPKFWSYEDTGRPAEVALMRLQAQREKARHG